MNESQPSSQSNVGVTAHGDAQAVERLREASIRLKAEIGKVVIGQDQVIDSLLVAFLSRGHALLIGVPGVGKTLMARSLARALDMEYRRIQFTPDLMPSDITGTDIIIEDPETNRRRLEFQRGPLFTNFLLADEINRAPPKTQSALLQAMQEQEVSVGRHTYSLSPPFFVVATQNPVEQEGTYPLPEAQLDRFMFNIWLDYPSFKEELQVVKLTTLANTIKANKVLSAEEILFFQDLVRKVPVADNVIEYAVKLVNKTRINGEYCADITKKYLQWGAGPRASQYLIIGAKCHAAINGKFSPDIEDVKAIAIPILRHRIIRNYKAEAEGVSIEAIIEQLL